MRRRYESPGMYSDDDANSDAVQRLLRAPPSAHVTAPLRITYVSTEDVAEVRNHCASSNWTERKEGLLGLQNLLKSQRVLRCSTTPLTERVRLKIIYSAVKQSHVMVNIIYVTSLKPVLSVNIATSSES